MPRRWARFARWHISCRRSRKCSTCASVRITFNISATNSNGSCRSDKLPSPSQPTPNAPGADDGKAKRTPAVWIILLVLSHSPLHAFGVDASSLISLLFPVPFSEWVTSARPYWSTLAERPRQRALSFLRRVLFDHQLSGGIARGPLRQPS